MVRFAGALISLGVGIAVLSGQGLAHAETSDGSSESSTGSSSAGDSPAAEDSPALSDDEPDDGDDPPTPAPGRKSRAAAVTVASEPEDDPEDGPIDIDLDDEDPDEGAPDAIEVELTEPDVPEDGPEEAVETATDNAPETPPAEPAAWALLAFTRREFESEPAGTTGTTGTAETAVAQTVENSLTYTPPPTIIDQLTLVALRLVRDITGFFGISYTAIVGELVASADPPFFLTFGLNARKTEFEVSPGNVWKVWEFTPPEPSGATVVAIHGGGFIIQPNLLHWIDYTQMARETGATVLVPLYPLGRTEAGSILNVRPGMADYLAHVIDERGAENVSVYADSGGSTYAFAATRELILRGHEVPARMVLVSLQPDFSTENDGSEIDDPFFNQVTVDYFSGFHIFDGVVDKDPRISPLRMETEVLQALPPTTIYVGSEEILLPATLRLYERAVDVGSPISVVIGRGQFHNWPVSGLPINSAAPLVRRDIYRQLGLLPD